MAGFYQRIAEQLRHQINTGERHPGDHLPTEPELMQAFGASRNTVRAAVEMLVNEGLVTKLPGRTGGSVVRERVTLTYHASRAEQPDGAYSESDNYFTEVRDQGHEPSQVFELRLVTLDPAIAARLRQPAGTSAALRRCVRSVNGHPTSIQDTYYPMDLAEQVRELLSPTDVPQGTTQLLASRGHVQVAFRDEIEARMPTPEQSALLRLAPGTPVLTYVRTGHTADRPVRVTVTTLSSDRNRIIYTLGRTELLKPPASPE